MSSTLGKTSLLLTLLAFLLLKLMLFSELLETLRLWVYLDFELLTFRKRTEIQITSISGLSSYFKDCIKMTIRELKPLFKVKQVLVVLNWV